MAKYVHAIEKHQITETEKARKACVESFGNSTLSNSTEAFFNEKLGKWICPAYWDNISCWPNTPENTQASIPCPSYIAGFDQPNNATRRCMENGTWFIHNEFHTYWSNYTQCFGSKSPIVVIDMPKPNSTKLVEYYLPTVKIISRTGYAVSFCTLIIAFLIMLSIKKLHCPRNKLHMHLFTSFILRAFVSLLKDLIFVQGIGLPSDFTYQNGSSYFFIDQKSNNWVCKLLTSFWEYFITANYSWILMEGLYLHNLIFRALFIESERNIVRYILLGWGLPFLVVIPWIILRIFIEDTFCWTTHEYLLTLLVIKIPTMISILINLVLFIKVSVVLYTKLQSSVNYEQAKRYQKWAKSTLVLVPLFGIHYSILIAMSFTIQENEVVEVVWLICDQLFASFQGFVVAILYCFLNGEVKSELKPLLHYTIGWCSSKACCKICFDGKYLSSAKGRTSVCTTMSCTSLYNNGIPQRNSTSRMDSRRKHSAMMSWSNGHEVKHGRRSLQNSVEMCQLTSHFKTPENGTKSSSTRSCCQLQRCEQFEEKMSMLAEK